LGTTSLWISKGSPTMSPTVIRGFSEVYGSWKTIWMSRRMARMSRPLGPCRHRSKITLPDGGLLEAHEQAAQGGLATPGLADDAQGLALVQVEAHAVDGLDVPDGAP
jgi:hypothetical protein